MSANFSLILYSQVYQQMVNNIEINLYSVINNVHRLLFPVHKMKKTGKSIERELFFEHY